MRAKKKLNKMKIKWKNNIKNKKENMNKRLNKIQNLNITNIEEKY